MRSTSFWRLLVLAMLLNIVTQALHEAGHWSVYQAFDRGPVWGFIGLVQLWDKTPLHPEAWVETISPDGEQSWLRLSSLPSKGAEEAIGAAAGPLASLLGVILGLFLAHRSRQVATRQMGLMLALLGSFVMTLYYLRSPLRVGGDEYDIAVHLGVPKYVIEIPLGLAFLACLILGLRELGGWRARLTWLGAILLGSVPTGLLLMQADGLVRTQVDLGSTLFQPVFGFSLPVILVNGLALFGLWLYLRQVKIE